MDKLLLIFHFVAIAMGTGMSFSNYVNLRVSDSEKGERRAALAGLRRLITQFADVIIVLIWATGLALLWGTRPEVNAWFYVKIAFVILLTIFHLLARRTAGQMTRTGDTSLHGRLELLVSGVWSAALVAICLAVVAFEK